MRALAALCTDFKASVRADKSEINTMCTKFFRAVNRQGKIEIHE